MNASVAVVALTLVSLTVTLRQAPDRAAARGDSRAANPGGRSGSASGANQRRQSVRCPIPPPRSRARHSSA